MYKQTRSNREPSPFLKTVKNYRSFFYHHIILESASNLQKAATNKAYIRYSCYAFAPGASTVHSNETVLTANVMLASHYTRNLS